jgi:hypothetical protein
VRTDRRAKNNVVGDGHRRQVAGAHRLLTDDGLLMEVRRPQTPLSNARDSSKQKIERQENILKCH